ncbi:unnamed protein product [Clavelina lepadiformis]|uniref:Hydantoinase B/oxoprolinase domain-containing protein n=1 Tax=Clavelina lepadiformis TaxID=159417 RepID=A0ABP0G9T0_CLALP
MSGLKKILFRKNLTLSVLSERRVFQPYGADVAMQDAVQYQMRTLKINEGDCILSHHPYAGEVHLPHLTVIM